MQLHISTRAQASLIGLSLALTMLVAPFGAAAATSTKPSCTLTITTGGTEMQVNTNKKSEVSVNKGDSLTIDWSGKSVKSVTLNGDDVAVSSTSTSTPTENTEYAFVFANGSKKVKCTLEVTVVQPASIDADSLSTGSSKPSLSGSAGGYKTLYLSISKKGDSHTLLMKKAAVSHGMWKYRSSKQLSDGSYDVRLTDKDGGATYASGTLTVGNAPAASSGTSASNLSLSFLPLLGGGTAHAFGNIPVMYLVVRNTGTETAHVTGITLREDGSAPASLITSLESSDDKGGSRATSSMNPFANGVGTSPTDALIPAGGVKIFTVKAQLGATAAAIGTQLQLNVTGITTDGQVSTGFPVRGTVWTIAQ